MSTFSHYKDAAARVAEIKESHGIVPEIKPFGNSWRLTFDPADEPLAPGDEDSIPAREFSKMIQREAGDDPLVQAPLKGI